MPLPEPLDNPETMREIQARARAYAAIDRIDWPQGFCRRDIGWRALDREKTA